jgi:hypothetical protein
LELGASSAIAVIWSPSDLLAPPPWLSYSLQLQTSTAAVSMNRVPTFGSLSRPSFSSATWSRLICRPHGYSGGWSDGVTSAFASAFELCMSTSFIVRSAPE